MSESPLSSSSQGLLKLICSPVAAILFYNNACRSYVLTPVGRVQAIPHLKHRPFEVEPRVETFCHRKGDDATGVQLNEKNGDIYVKGGVLNARRVTDSRDVREKWVFEEGSKEEEKNGLMRVLQAIFNIV